MLFYRKRATDVWNNETNQDSGPIDTKIFQDGETKGLFDSKVLGNATLLKRMGKADEVAKVLCFLLSDDASYVTGGS
jgi:NAD(P)-dependent dehydrogenase (short-subunit alcohol dehydrogenase family)